MGSMSCIWSDLNAPGTKTPLSHSILKLGEFPFPLLALWVIRIALPIWKWKSWKSSSTKWAQWAAYGLFWMPQALKPLCHIQFLSWVNPSFHYWPSGVIRIVLPVLKLKSWKSSSTKWAQWAAYGLIWMPQALKLLCAIHIGRWEILPTPIISPLG